MYNHWAPASSLACTPRPDYDQLGIAFYSQPVSHRHPCRQYVFVASHQKLSGLFSSMLTAWPRQEFHFQPRAALAGAGLRADPRERPDTSFRASPDSLSGAVSRGILSIPLRARSGTGRSGFNASCFHRPAAGGRVRADPPPQPC